MVLVPWSLVGDAATFDSSEGAAKAMTNQAQALNVSLNISIVRKRVRGAVQGVGRAVGSLGIDL